MTATNRSGILFSMALQGILHKNCQIPPHTIGEPHFLCYDGLEIGKISEGLPIPEIVEDPSPQVSVIKAQTHFAYSTSQSRMTCSSVHA